MQCNGKIKLHIVVDIHGTQKDLDVLVDTGFTSGTGFGLKLPVNYAIHAKVTGTGTVNLANNDTVKCDTIPNAKIVQIENHVLDDEVTLPALFMEGPQYIGMMFLQGCHLNIDGPKKEAFLDF
jgi:predicted aspartyl protease